MDDTRLRTIAQLEEFLKATPQVAFTALRQGGAGEDQRSEHICRVLTRFDYAHRNKRERGVALALPEVGHLLACDISAEYTAIGRPHWLATGVARAQASNSPTATRRHCPAPPAVNRLRAC